MKKKATSSTIAGTTLGKEGPSPPPPHPPPPKNNKIYLQIFGVHCS